MTDLRQDMDLRVTRDTPVKPKRARPVELPGQQTIRRYQSGDFTLTGLLWKKATRSPKRTLTTIAAAGAGLAIFTNLMLLQPETHKSPIFVGNPRIHSAPVPTEAPVPMQRPATLERDAEAARRAGLTKDIQFELSSRGFFAGEADGQSSPRLTQAIREFQQLANLPANGQVSDGLLASILTSSIRPKDQLLSVMKPMVDRLERPDTVVAIQRALTKLGLGPLRDDGQMGPGTRAALDRFEQSRKLPSRDDNPQRVLRELAQASGIAIP